MFQLNLISVIYKFRAGNSCIVDIKINERTLIGQNPVGISNKRGLGKSAHSGYRDQSIIIKGIQHKSSHGSVPFVFVICKVISKYSYFIKYFPDCIFFYSLTKNNGVIKRIYKMSSWQFVNRFFFIFLPKLIKINK